MDQNLLMVLKPKRRRKSRAKYQKGDKITSLDELMAQELVYCFDKITPYGWFQAWQMRLASQYIRMGALFKAVRKEKMKRSEAVAVLNELLEVDSLKILDTLTDEQIDAIWMARDVMKDQELLGEQYTKIPYIFCMTLCHYRTGASMGKIFGAVFADSIDEAESIVWDKYGGDLCCGLWVEEVPRDGTSHTIYKNMI